MLTHLHPDWHSNESSGLNVQRPDYRNQTRIFSHTSCAPDPPHLACTCKIRNQSGQYEIQHYLDIGSIHIEHTDGPSLRGVQHAVWLAGLSREVPWTLGQPGVRVNASFQLERSIIPLASGKENLKLTSWFSGWSCMARGWTDFVAARATYSQRHKIEHVTHHCPSNAGAWLCLLHRWNLLGFHSCWWSPSLSSSLWRSSMWAVFLFVHLLGVEFNMPYMPSTSTSKATPPESATCILPWHPVGSGPTVRDIVRDIVVVLKACQWLSCLQYQDAGKAPSNTCTLHLARFSR